MICYWEIFDLVSWNCVIPVAFLFFVHCLILTCKFVLSCAFALTSLNMFIVIRESDNIMLLLVFLEKLQLVIYDCAALFSQRIKFKKAVTL